MMLSCNRFAFVPHLCSECKRYIWLESYRKANVWKNFINRSIKENICKSCLVEFGVATNRKRKKIMDKCPICEYELDNRNENESRYIHK
jgi:hypothetical protein